MSKFLNTVVFLVLIANTLSAQSHFFRYTITDQSAPELVRFGARKEANQTVTIMAAEKADAYHYVSITITPDQQGIYKDGLKPGKYFFSTSQQLLNSSSGYTMMAQFGKLHASTLSMQYQTSESSVGYVELEMVTATEIKGKFLF